MNTVNQQNSTVFKNENKRLPTFHFSSDDSESFDPGSDDEPPQPGGPSKYFFKNIPDHLWNDWSWQFKNRITSVDTLVGWLPLTGEERNSLNGVVKEFPLSITPYYLSLLDPSNAHDPVYQQCIPSSLETDLSTQGYEDPLDETGDSVVPGLVHRYSDRALMLVTNICPVLCRHCTRKREWHNKNMIRSKTEIRLMFDYIRAHREIWDVIISGGDPLTLSTGYLEYIVSNLRGISHVEIIRIGTRIPVVLPQRIDDNLCSMLSKYGPIWLNTHFNSINEINSQSAAACDRLLRSGVPVNNQSVLLRGVNDTVEKQLALCQGLLKIKVRPYYLFQCDEVKGVEHLRTPVNTGLEILEGMRGRTSGFAIPSFVVDLPDGGGKVPLLPDYIISHSEHEIVFRNYQGRVLHYRDPQRSSIQSAFRQDDSSYNAARQAPVPVLP